MKVLTVYAHHDPKSFCHAVLQRFTAGLQEAGHTNTVIDLYADDFDPVSRDRDVPSYTSGNMPEVSMTRSRAAVVRFGQRRPTTSTGWA
ncbi:Flavodoxin-like fold [Nakamurella panacisegetis]|uniref:Flavodoxin-like fold n=1 Tax=Nakamurella panacisegetis TaxID=1090615 RepID=A0A1H0LPA1_9ACTN|nr:NAD(P)H-dependent oxidoreductase [Nakamurella panacisegetis]SDO69816.1 Flavodoxin-like fold [Nakamurella panacisegetis]